MITKTFYVYLKALKSLCFCLALVLPLFSLSAQETEASIVNSFDNKELQWGGCPEFMPEGCQIAVLHGDPAKMNSDILFKVEGKSSIPNHWHNSAERMILLKGKMEVHYKGEVASTLKEGDYAFGPAKKEHSAKCVSSSPCVLFIAFNAPVDAFASK